MKIKRQHALVSQRRGCEYDEEILERRGIHRPKASWRYMSAMQPPLPAFGLTTSSRTLAGEARYDFFGMLANGIVKQTQPLVAAQDLQVLGTGLSSSDGDEGGEFVLNSEKHAAEDSQGVDPKDPPLLIRVRRATVLTSNPSEALKLTARYSRCQREPHCAYQYARLWHVGERRMFIQVNRASLPVTHRRLSYGNPQYT